MVHLKREEECGWKRRRVFRGGCVYSVSAPAVDEGWCVEGWLKGWWMVDGVVDEGGGTGMERGIGK